MDALLRLLIQGLGVALVDVDNSMYTTKRISGLNTRRRLAVVLSLALEFVGRLGLVYFFLSVAGAQKPLFEVFGLQFTVETISLFVAGAYLLISNGRELTAVLRNPTAAESDQPAAVTSFPRLMLEMTRSC
jgi:predicted tellurium resistance membrane protein TerC